MISKEMKVILVKGNYKRNETPIMGYYVTKQLLINDARASKIIAHLLFCSNSYRKLKS